jgi:hypothetical protein
MKSKAILMTLAMMSAALAGCTGSDGVAEIDDETLQQLFEDNIQDFMNNTSVTVHQEIHYHNNTTVNNYETTNEYSNTTNVEGGEVINNYENNYSSIGTGQGNASSVGTILHGIDFEFTLHELWGLNSIEPGDRNNDYTTNWTYYDYLTNQQRDDFFTFSCSVYYIVGSGSNSSHGSDVVTYWVDNDWYEDAWQDSGYNSTMREIFQNVAFDSELRFACDEDYYGESSGYYAEIIYRIDIPQGFAFRCDTRNTGEILWREESGSSNWTQAGTWPFYSNIRIEDDSIGYSVCNFGNTPEFYVGNGEPFEILISGFNLVENTNYRLTFNYELRPIVTVE